MKTARRSLREHRGQPDHKAGRAKKAMQGRRDRRVRRLRALAISRPGFGEARLHEPRIVRTKLAFSIGSGQCGVAIGSAPRRRTTSGSLELEAGSTESPPDEALGRSSFLRAMIRHYFRLRMKVHLADIIGLADPLERLHAENEGLALIGLERSFCLKAFNRPDRLNALSTPTTPMASLRCPPIKSSAEWLQSRSQRPNLLAAQSFDACRTTPASRAHAHVSTCRRIPDRSRRECATGP